MKREEGIKAVFIDLDGTLLQRVDTISPRNIQAIKRIKEKGILPVITTGRPAYEADFAVRATEADSYMIAMNGLAVYEDYRSHKLLYEAYMQNKASEQIISYLLEQRVFFEVYIGDRAYCQSDVKPLIYDCGMAKDKIRFFLNTMQEVDDLPAYLKEKNVHINKLFFSKADVENIMPLRRVLDSMKGVQTLASSENYVEILPEGADKKRAVHAVCRALGLSPEEVMVIGDSENDIGMFDEAATCVAMGNAFPQLKAKANYIAPTNYEDGVAWALETLLIGDSDPKFTGHIETIAASEIEAAMEHSTRQYLAGNLKLPQQLKFLRDTEVECGISGYPYYKWEKPHYHTIANEYCYILCGETKYIDLSQNVEYHFRAGDFYVLRNNTPYLQKCQAGCRLFFVKVPGVNDKVSIPMTASMEHWCAAWEADWDGVNHSQNDRT